MVSKTLLLSFVASLAQVNVVVSEPRSGVSLDHIQKLLSQHITDLSALLDQFKNTDQTTLLQGPSTNSSAAPLACNCQDTPLDSACRIMCGSHEDGPIPPAAPLACDCHQTPLDSACRIMCGSHEDGPIPSAGSSAAPLACNCHQTPLDPACRIMCGSHEDGPIPTILADSEKLEVMAAPLACNCQATPLDPACRIMCGSHEGGPIDPPIVPDSDKSNDSTIDQILSPAGVLPLRFVCRCVTPIASSCRNFCANHGGNINHPPSWESRLAPPSNEAGLRSTGSQQPIPDTGSNPERDACDCHNPPTLECKNFCESHGRRGNDTTDDGHGNPSDNTPSQPGENHGARQPPSDSEPPACTLPNCLHNHGQGAAVDGAQVRLSSGQQNASMPLPGSSNPNPNTLNTAAAEPLQLSLTIPKADGTSSTIAASVDLTSYASFAASSTISDLGFAGEIHRTPEQPVTIHSQPCKVVGTVALLLPDFGLYEVFYVVEPSVVGDEDIAGLPALTVGVDFLQQIGGLNVKSHLLV